MKKKNRFRRCVEHPDYDGSFMPLGRGCADCYHIWYICGQRLDERKQVKCIRDSKK